MCSMGFYGTELTSEIFILSGKKGCDSEKCMGGNSCCGMDGHLCDVGEGDCDSDSDCKAGLICGARGSCPQEPGTDFEPNDECCIKP